MNGTERSWGFPSLWRFACAALAICSIAGSGASSAGAQSFIKVDVFAGSEDVEKEEGSVFGQQVQLGGVGGMAVNIDGNGGVPAGTIYAATGISSDLRVARFNPDGSFSEAWRVTLAEPPDRCGPDSEGGPACAPRVQAGAGWVDVDVDQTTGNVYVFNGEQLAPGIPLVTVYDAKGSKVIDRFAPRAELGESTALSPGKVHTSSYPGGLAVNAAGEVYVFDVNFEDNFYHRLMVFTPEPPGDFENYVYAGQGADVGAGFGGGNWPLGPVADSAGNIYVGGAGGDYVAEYDPSQPANPICEFEFAQGGITSLTVNPITGEPYFFSYKLPKRLRQLSACHEGKFSEQGTIEVKPERDDLYALAFDPKRKFSPAREVGVLYGGAPSPGPGIGHGQAGQSSLGYMFAPVEELSPKVESQSVANVGTAGATLKAIVNPQGSPTRYVFQYLSNAAFKAQGEDFEEAEEAPLGGGEVGSGLNDIAVAAPISGLEPATEYQFRVVVTSHCSGSDPAKVCEAAGAAQQFQTFGPNASDLPDQRAWELVSPPQKNGGQVIPADPKTSSCGIIICKPGITYAQFPLQSAADGNAVVYEGSTFTPSGGAVIENEYIARRDEGGWRTVNLSPSLLASGSGQGYMAFDAGLSSGVLKQIDPPLHPEAPPGYADLYRQPTSSSMALSPLLTSPPPNRGTGSGTKNAFEMTYAGASNDLSRIFFDANDALAGEAPFAPAAVDGGEGKLNLYEWSEGQLNLVNVLPGNTTTAPGSSFGGQLARNPNAISDDGSHVFWSSEGGQVYVRIDAQETVEIEDSGKFLSAADDGSRVLLANGCLYDLDGAECEDLTGGSGGFKGITGQSEDLSHIYFVDTAVLTGEEQNNAGAKAQAGSFNLYAWVNGTTRFVATLLVADSSDWAALPVLRTAEASLNGRFAAFVSQAALTGRNNIGPCKNISGTTKFKDGPCPEVFLYDSTGGELICASCAPTGTAPVGGAVLRFSKARYLTDSGRLFFDSGDPLVPADTNGRVEDVYEYEPQGVGDCEREGGCIALLSSGREVSDSNFLAVDPSGDNVFFTTRDRLVPGDGDELIDLYDARVGGGFPESSLPIRCNSAEACQPLGPPSPEQMPSPGPTEGNFKPPKHCKKGQVRRNGHCVKKKVRHKKSNRTSRDRGGSK